MSNYVTPAIILFLTVLCSLAACSNDSSPEEKQTQATPPFIDSAAALQQDLGDKRAYLVTIHTSMGEMKAVLFNQTPLHRDNFVKLIDSGFYDSLHFHRVIKDFMIQGGDPESRTAPPDVMLGDGGPGYTIPAEFHPDLIHQKGALAAARKGDDQNPEKASSGSQFYIVQGMVYDSEAKIREASMPWPEINRYLQQLFTMPKYEKLINEFRSISESGDQQKWTAKLIETIPVLEEEFDVNLQPHLTASQIEAYTTIGGAPHLDRGYTVFGQVISGLDVIDRIASVPVNRQLGNRPKEPVVFSMEVEELKKKKIAKQYHYVFPK